jgi:uncharacterized protein YcnI/ketosteroid isomerase-like protein
MRRFLGLAVMMMAVPALASAHVSVRPAASKPGVEENYMVRVPTEGKVATTSVVFDVPEAVTVTAVPDTDGVKAEIKRVGGRIVQITWTKEIPPAQNASFAFAAKNPAAGALISWKAEQKFADGTARTWTPTTTLSAEGAAAATRTAEHVGQHAPPAAGTNAIEKWLKEYDAAFIAKDLDKLAAFYHPDVTIYEGGGINNGWVDYRDNHLGPELKQFQNLQFSHSDVKVTPLGDGSAAYVTAKYTLKAQMGERAVDSGGLATHVLIRDGSAWKIRHSHTSSRPRRPPQ